MMLQLSDLSSKPSLRQCLELKSQWGSIVTNPTVTEALPANESLKSVDEQANNGFDCFLFALVVNLELFAWARVQASMARYTRGTLNKTYCTRQFVT